MNIDILMEYAAIQEEIKELEVRIKRKEEQLHKLREMGTVKDSVQAMTEWNTIGHAQIEGIPNASIHVAEKSLEKSYHHLTMRQNKLMEMTNQIEEFIDACQNSRVRVLMDYKFLDGLTWREVAKKMGPGYTDSQCQMAVKRYLASLPRNEDDLKTVEEKNKKFYRGNA